MSDLNWMEEALLEALEVNQTPGQRVAIDCWGQGVLFGLQKKGYVAEDGPPYRLTAAGKGKVRELERD